MEILLEEIDAKGAAIAKENGIQAGKMTYSKAGAALIIIDHTEVEPEFNEKGVGKLMLYEIVEMTRKRNIKIMPLCPFASAMFKKLDDIRDVLKS